MKNIKPEDWMPDAGITLEEAADQAVRSSDHVLVIAGPGAGKTELLAQKAAYLFQTNNCKAPRKILAISFKKDAAENLKERVEKRCGTDVKDRFTSLTYDAFAKRILDHFLYALPEDTRPLQNYTVNDNEIINAAFVKAGYNNPYNLSSSKLKAFYDTTLAGVSLPLRGDSLEVKVWRYLLKGFDGRPAALTFKMIGMLADYIVLTNPKIVNALQLTYSDVFLDEFQDTTAFQYAFVKHCFMSSGTRIIAVGDNKQRIMLWAGALRGIFNRFYEEFNPEGLRLLRNYRSAPRLVLLQKEMYNALKEKKTEVIPSEKWASDAGEITLFIAEDEKLEALAVVEDIKKQLAEGIEPKDMCILCKQKPQDYSLSIIAELEKHGIHARIETEYQDLLKEPIVELILNILSCAINRKQPQKWEQVVTAVMDLWNVDTTQGNTSYEQVQDRLYQLTEQVGADMKSEVSAELFQKLIQRIRELLDDAHLKAYFPEYQQGNYLEEQLDKFIKLFSCELIKTGEWTLAIESFSGLHSIPIMTIHKSKGLEFSAVYFLGLEDSAFWSFATQPEEDRCAFFVALSRAKKAVAFTFCNQRTNFKYPQQSHKAINEFFELLQKPGIAEVKVFSLNPNIA